MVESDSSWVHYGVRSKSYMIFNIGLPSYERHIIPTNPMSANQNINSAISPDHLISQIAVYVGLPNITASSHISESSFMSACQISRHHAISPNRRSCRLAKNHGLTHPYHQVSWYRQVRWITAYLGSSCDASKNLAEMPAKTWL